MVVIELSVLIDKVPLFAAVKPVPTWIPPREEVVAVGRV